MKIEEYISGHWESCYKYKYFVPSLINHSFSNNGLIVSSSQEKE